MISKIKIKKLRDNPSQGFTLLELLVVMAIVGIFSTYGIFSLRRNFAQGQVDRYTQFVETGLFSLRARLGRFKRGCELYLDQDLSTNTWGPPWKLLEFQQPDGSQSNSTRFKCCYDEITEEQRECTPEDLSGKASYRFLTMEGTRESKSAIKFVQSLDNGQPTKWGGTYPWQGLDAAFEDNETDTLYFLSDGEPNKDRLGGNWGSNDYEPTANHYSNFNNTRTRALKTNTISLGLESPWMEKLSTQTTGDHLKVDKDYVTSNSSK